VSQKYALDDFYSYVALISWTSVYSSCLFASIPCAARVSPSISGRSAWCASPTCLVTAGFAHRQLCLYAFLHTVFQLSAVVHSLSLYIPPGTPYPLSRDLSSEQTQQERCR